MSLAQSRARPMSVVISVITSDLLENPVLEDSSSFSESLAALEGVSFLTSVFAYGRVFNCNPSLVRRLFVASDIN